MDAARRIGTLPDGAVVHVGGAGAPRVASRMVGNGRVIFVADEWAISNAGLASADNLALALGIVMGDGPRAVVFDEYHHGYATGGGAWDRLALGIQLALVQVALAALVLVVARGRRLGTPVAATASNGRLPTDYVDSLADLWRRAGASASAGATLAKGFEREIAARFGVGMRDPTAAKALLASRGLAQAAKAAELGRTEISDDRSLVALATAIAKGRREVAGADRRHRRARRGAKG